MGSGIVLLTALEMADLALDPAHKDRAFALNAVDISRPGADRAGQVPAGPGPAGRREEDGRPAGRLRRPDRPGRERGDHPPVRRGRPGRRPADDAARGRLRRRRWSSRPSARTPDLKVKLLSQIKAHNTEGRLVPDQHLLHPHLTSSTRRSGLGGRIIGFHFYNPPAVQKLVEVIRAETTLPELAEFAAQYAKKLRKTVVPSNDVAGFIGNGHFMRDALHGIAEVERLAPEFGFADAVYMVNKVSQDFLIRPMGIFQLVDYVGLDVCQCILRVMNERLPGQGLHSPLVDRLIELGVSAGSSPTAPRRTAS